MASPRLYQKYSVGLLFVSFSIFQGNSYEPTTKSVIAYSPHAFFLFFKQRMYRMLRGLAEPKASMCMKRLIYLLALILTTMASIYQLEAQPSDKSRRTLGEEISNDLAVFIHKGAQEFVNEEFGILKIPKNIWHKFTLDEHEWKSRIGEGLNTAIPITDMNAIIHKHVESYNRSNPSQQIRTLQLQEGSTTLSPT